ncbi:MAG: putative thymidylate synthase [Promethearchaeota archaeon]|nr:MAG: putative thymidylate synthase [Candidatus Lokiarchaeota archaeon]
MKVFHIKKENIRDAWLTAIGKVLFEGDSIKTEYDKPEDSPSKDATVLIEVEKPMSNPITRKERVLKIKSKYGNSYELYGCMADTYLVGSIQSGYIEEIMEGTNDHYIWDSGLSFPYSYHDRIFNYAPYSLEDSVHVNYDLDIVKTKFIKSHQKLNEAKKIQENGDSTIWRLKNGLEFDLDKRITDQVNLEKIPIEILEFPRINQMNYIIDKLKKSPYSRRAQAITWRPLSDPYHDDPPCLQRIFMRIKQGKLMMQTTWRSRDLFRAWEANVNGMVRIQKRVAEELNVEMGHYVDFSNSLHIYGNSIPEVNDMLKRMKNKGELNQKILDLIEKYEN